MNNLDILNKIIKEYSDKHKKLVVGIDGYTGIGKTTLLDDLIKKNKNILPVYRDDFIKPRREIKKLLDKASDKSEIMELKWCNDKKIIDIIKEYKKSNRKVTVLTYNPKTGEQDVKKTYDFSKKILIVEGIFLLHPKLYKNIFDLKIFLDGSIRKADKRRIKREKKRWGKNYFPENHPDSFFRLVKIAFRRYRKLYNPKKLADIVIKI